MKIHEYLAKAILKQYGILVPKGKVVTTLDEAESVASELGSPVMVKAQIPAGGRGKAGGIRKALTVTQAGKITAQLLNKKIITPQTPSEGLTVKKVLVEEKLEIQREFYIGIMVDISKECPLILVSDFGGIDMEEIAEKSPDSVYKEYIDPLLGLQPFQKRKLAFNLEIESQLVAKMTKVISNLYRVFETKDCLLVEINPLVLTEGADFYALDAKMVFDDNALFRQPGIEEFRDYAMEDPLEAEAIKHGLSYVRLEGNIGCMMNGAGLAMATMDTIKFFGGEPANFLDVGGGAGPERIKTAFSILLSDPLVKVVFINIFGGMFRCDFLAEGLLETVKQKKLKAKLILRLEGTNSAQGLEMLRRSGLKFVAVFSIEEGVKKAVELSRNKEKNECSCR